MTEDSQYSDVIEQLLQENPKLHYISQDMEKEGLEACAKHGFHFQTGLINLAVHPEIIRYLRGCVNLDSLTLETGSGHTTVALAALAKHHICISPDEMGRRLIEDYMEKVGIPKSKVTFIEESSDTALPRLSLSEKLDFAYVDDCHGYPFPALDWHFIDKHLKIGGTIGFDNTEIPTVKHHCDFMDANQSYRLIKAMDLNGNGVNIYRKERDELREWVFQAFNERKHSSLNGGAWRRRARRFLRRVRRAMRSGRELSLNFWQQVPRTLSRLLGGLGH